MNSSPIPDRLKALREASGLSIRALAEKLGMSSSGYAHYETPSRFKDAFLPMRVAHDIAAALRPYHIDPEQVMALAGGKAAHTPAPPPGMAESAAAPWAAPPDKRNQVETMLRTLAPQAAQPATYLLSRDLIPLGLLRGDVIVVDRRAAPAAGDLALGNARTEDGPMITVIGRYLPPLLFTSESLTSGQIYDVKIGRASCRERVLVAV